MLDLCPVDISLLTFYLFRFFFFFFLSFLYLFCLADMFCYVCEYNIQIFAFLVKKKSVCIYSKEI